EIAVVDDGAHGNADARTEQEDAQSDGERDRREDRDDPGPRQKNGLIKMNEPEKAVDLPTMAAAEERVQAAADRWVPDHVDEPDEREQQADGDHQLHDQRLALQVTHDAAVERDTG